jgi:hypothetical protein
MAARDPAAGHDSGLSPASAVLTHREITPQKPDWLAGAPARHESGRFEASVIGLYDDTDDELLRLAAGQQITAADIAAGLKSRHQVAAA